MLKSEKYKGFKIYFSEDQNYRGTYFVNVYKIIGRGHNIMNDIPTNTRQYGSTGSVDGWTKREAFINAKEYIDDWREQGG